MTDEPQITGFPQGTVVRRHGKPPNLLVVRWLGETTTVISAEIDETGIRQLLEYPTAELRQVFPHD